MMNTDIRVNWSTEVHIDFSDCRKSKHEFMSFRTAWMIEMRRF